MIEVVNLTKNFKNIKAVDNVNLYIEPGEIVGLLGPNGAGKSTTIALISTLIQPTAGDVLFQQQSVINNPKLLRDVLGVVPQEVALYKDLTARENLQFFGTIQKIPKGELQGRINAVLKQVGLEDDRKKLVKYYSSGMRRRLNIGAALLHKPAYLIMDEPTVGIDPQSRSYILQAIKQLNQEDKTAIIYTSHYMEEVEFLCDRLYIMDQGKIIAAGTMEEIKAILSSEKTIEIKLERHSKSFVEALTTLKLLSNIQIAEAQISFTVEKNTDFLSVILPLCEAHNIVLKGFHVKEPTLEDVFLHLTGRALRD
ncbi:ABC transporter ATP-binding protein [Bacillus ndiopicus]|uniref:ABC transporter ATP-binding protein n=1 Tax=Bacillus ndiopicus TaxID=1347368 RepID=UPI0005AB37D2|nr:ABC transporter ATP-binding protein [Bacillus ndiopicus]